MRLVIAAGVMYLFGPVVGLKAAAVAYGIETGGGYGWIWGRESPLPPAAAAPVAAVQRPPQPQVRQIPIGMKNETGSDSFINAYLQAAVLDDSALMHSAMQTRWTRELGGVLRAYQTESEGNVISGAKSIRMTLGRNHSGVYRSGSHDPIKAFQFLHDPSYAPHRDFQKQTIREYQDLPDGMSREDFKKHLREQGAAMVGEDARGVYTIRYNTQFDGCTRLAAEEGLSLEKMILKSLKYTSLERMPKALTFEIEGEKTPLASVRGESLIPDAELFPDKKHHTYELTSFIRQQGEVYVAYVKRGGQYFECRDEQIRGISRWDFRGAATSGDSIIKLVKYTCST